MVRDVSRTSAVHNIDLAQLHMSKLSPQLPLGANIVVTMATGFVAAHFVFKQSTVDSRMVLPAGIVAMSIAMIVEAFFLVSKICSIDEASCREKRTKDRVQNRE